MIHSQKVEEAKRTLLRELERDDSDKVEWLLAAIDALIQCLRVVVARLEFLRDRSV